MKYVNDSRVCLSLANDILGEIGDTKGRPGFGTSRHNVGLWLLGFAVELAYKAVVAAHGIEPAGSHCLTTVASRPFRALRRRVEKQLKQRLELSQRGLSVSQLWNYIDVDISYMSRRYWNVSPRGSTFSATHFDHLSRADDNYSIVAADVYEAASALLELAVQQIQNIGIEQKEYCSVNWRTDSLSEGFPQAPTVTAHPPLEVESAVASETIAQENGRDRFEGTCSVDGCSRKPTDTLHVRSTKVHLVLPLCSYHGNPES